MKNSKLAVHRFAHSAMVNGLSCLMGLFKDDKAITADRYKEADSMKARTSIISPMAANHVFVLYNCTIKGYLVQHLFNEMDVEIPGCAAPCRLDKLNSLWKPIEDDCQLDKMCSLSQDSGAVTEKMSLLLIIMMSLHVERFY